VPLLSEDITLLSLLGELFAVMLTQTRLQSQRRAHDRQARELALQASRSELKALRAQINPHFLFNALNTIGGLIRRDPEEADRVVERLAEVFRYTLTRSDAEWVRVDEEFDFVRAYLEVERARFGDRLQVAVHVDDTAAPCLVPTMAVQTLVENAVKHGVAQARGPVAVRVEAGLDGGRLTVRVVNTGGAPRGQRAGDRVGFAPEGKAAAGTGHGLANIRARLAGYFGGEALLTLEHVHEIGETRARLALPALRVPPVAAATPLQSVS
jgi:two-component system LytT family sensor kinase